MERTVRLSRLLEGMEDSRIQGDPAVEVRGLCYDSRAVRPGDLFFGLPGQRADGSRFATEALGRGAAAVMVPEGAETIPAGVVVRVPDVRRAMARAAARFFADPSRSVVLLGVTGTNGKTTFTYLLESMLREAGFRPGVIGTIAYRYGDRSFRPPNTTPESVDLQRILREMAEDGVTHALLEVSSHGLDYFRVESCHFACGVFTMLGRDHLDHHGDMETYFASKARFFSEVLPASGAADPFAVVNRDDPYGLRLLDRTLVPAVTVGRTAEADYRLDAVRATREGISLTVHGPRTDLDLRSSLLTGVNAQNVLTAAATADRLGLSPEAIARGVEGTASIPGRLERVGEDPRFLCVVDYAHTPDALDRVLEGLRPLTPGRMITVFGCGGDRDRGKRPLMGEAAGRWSDLVLVTSDNPRSEPPEAIIEEILEGVRKAGLSPWDGDAPLPPGGDRRVYGRTADRRQAIGRAVSLAAEGDTVVIAGKGHEEIQIVGDRRVPFQDVEEVAEALRRRTEEERAVG